MSTEIRNNRRNIFSMAWNFIRKYNLSMSEALRLAWRNFKLKAKLFEGVVRFRFTKSDGTIREAWGTLSSSRTPETKGTGRKVSEHLQAYWDVERESFRSFRKVNLLSID